MAKNIQKKSAFSGGALEGLIVGNTHPHVDTSTHTDTHTHTPTPVPKKERKTRRVQLLLKESAVNALDTYARDQDTSRNDIIQNLIDEFLVRQGYTDV